MDTLGKLDVGLGMGLGMGMGVGLGMGIGPIGVLAECDGKGVGARKPKLGLLVPTAAVLKIGTPI